MHGPIAPKRKYLHRPKPGLVYFRAGKKSVQLPSDEDSPEFAHQYEVLLAKLQAAKPRPAHRPSRMVAQASVTSASIRPPAIKTVIAEYLASDYFAVPNKPKPKVRPLRLSTQYNYRLAFKLMRDIGLTETSLHDLNPANAKAYINKIKKEHSGATAKLQKHLLSILWTFAVDEMEIDVGSRSNPMREVKNPYTLRQEHKPWPEEVQDRFLAACNDDLKLAFYLLLCTGQRVGDVIRMKWDDFNGTHIRLVQKKDRTGRQLVIKVPKVLIAQLRERERKHECILTHAWGRPWADGPSLYHRIKKVLREVGGGDLTVHGLRKNAGIMLAMNGATERVIMAALGHRSPAMAAYYIRLANEHALADQAGDIFDLAFEKRVAAKRAKLRVVE